MKAVWLAVWQFVGRVGLAARRLVALAWRPIAALARGARATWRLLGRMGLALRTLLTYGVWWPLLLLLYPIGLLYEHTLLRFLDGLADWLYRLFVWLARWLWTAVTRAWAALRIATEPQRARWRRRWRSRWLVWQARWRIFWRRRKPPATAVFVPRIPTPPNVRRLRLLTALVSLIAIFMVSFFTLQERGEERVSADNRILSRILVVTSTPPPQTAVTPTPEPSPTPLPTPWPTPDPLTEGGSLAFTLHLNGNSDIYLLPVGRAEPLRLTSHPEPDRQPAWSPNGREIAFSSRRSGDWEIYVYNLPFGELRRVTNSPGYDGSPAWSPDGQWLVYESYRNQNMDIQIIRADGSEGPYRLTEHAALDYAPAWSPGGRHVAFVSWRSGGPDLWLLSLDQVSDETAVNLTGTPGIYEAHPAFSPDGRYLAYYDRSTGYPLLSAIPLDERLNRSGAVISLGQQGYHPAWSPNSQALVFVVESGERSFLMAGSPNAWGVAPQTFASNGRLADPSWSAITLPLDLIENWQPIDAPLFTDVPLFIEALAAPITDTLAAPVQLFQVPINAPSPYLSDKVDQSFLALRQRVIQETGWDYLGQLDNMFMPLSSKPLPGQSAESWNKAGRAFDTRYQEALAFDPRVEVVREEIGTQTYWRIYLRTTAQDGSMGEPLRARSWDFRARFGNEPRYYNEGGRLKEAIPPGYYVDFTALAADYGWQRVPASENWRTFFPGIRFWHYQNRGGLTWAEAMREIYTEEEWRGP